MFVTLSGIVTNVRLLHRKNVLFPILVTAEPISTSNGLFIHLGPYVVLPSDINPAATSAGQSIVPSIR